MKIQGDGRKFLDHFKLFLVTIITTIIKLGPYLPITAKIRKSEEKVIFKNIFLSLIILSRHHRLQMVNETNEVLLGEWPH